MTIPADDPTATARIFVVTGANSGLGFVTARELARSGQRVIMAVRSTAKGEEAAQRIRDEVPGAVVDVRALDLADLASIRSFAAAVDRVDVLVNNAGIMMPPRTTTKDGFERQLGTNHLGHFALTGLLLHKLEAGTDPRVVTVSSIEHRPGRIDFEDLHHERDYQPRSAYQQSKLANALFGLELDRRLRAAGSPVISVLAHPGYSATNLQSAGPTGLMKMVLAVGNKLVAQSAERGAEPQIHAATAADVEGGQFFGPDGFQEYRGRTTLVSPSGRAQDEATARRLWDVSAELTGVSYL